MLLRRKLMACAVSLPIIAVAGGAGAQRKAPVIKIGSLQDGSGPYGHLGGAGSVASPNWRLTKWPRSMG
jgi:hypothetical protein